MTAAFAALAVTLALAAPATPAAPTLAERLGYERDARLLIVHADDIGEWHAAATATGRAGGPSGASGTSTS